MESQPIPVTITPFSGKFVNQMNRDSVDTLYDHASGTTVSISLRTLCNQIIHSFVFTFCFSQSDQMEGFVVSSDYEKEKKLFYLDLRDYINLLRRVSEDDIVCMMIKHDAGATQTKIIRKSNRILGTSK